MVTLRPSCKDGENSYTCVGCGEPVRADCSPSPGEGDELCRSCFYEDGDAA